MYKSLQIKRSGKTRYSQRVTKVCLKEGNAQMKQTPRVVSVQTLLSPGYGSPSSFEKLLLPFSDHVILERPGILEPCPGHAIHVSCLNISSILVTRVSPGGGHMTQTGQSESFLRINRH